MRLLPVVQLLLLILLVVLITILILSWARTPAVSDDVAPGRETGWGLKPPSRGGLTPELR